MRVIVRNTEKEFSNTFPWWSIDPKKVKQRIDQITNQIEEVLRRVESGDSGKQN
jgi:hypothetical protein